MNDIFWLRQGILAGSAGPNRVPWDISQLPHQNIGRILSVNDGELIRQDDLARYSVEHFCIPLSKNAPPQHGDLQYCLRALPSALQVITSNTELATLVHCSSGKDRTGMLLCYYLCKVENYTAEQAVREVKRVRPIALSAPGWEELTLKVLKET